MAGDWVWRRRTFRKIFLQGWHDYKSPGISPRYPVVRKQVGRKESLLVDELGHCLPIHKVLGEWLPSTGTNGKTTTNTFDLPPSQRGGYDVEREMWQNGAAQLIETDHEWCGDLINAVAIQIDSDSFFYSSRVLLGGGFWPNYHTWYIGFVTIYKFEKLFEFEAADFSKHGIQQLFDCHAVRYNSVKVLPQIKD